MELRVSPEKQGFSSSDVASDTEREISEGEDDDDRNHKHRRRDAGSQSLEGDSLDQHFPRPYRKRNRPFENGYSDPQSGESWKNYNNASDREFPPRFDRRRLNQASYSKAPPELNQRIRGNQMMPYSRFGLVDVASQMVQPGHVPSAMFGGRGFPNVSNAQGTAWNAYGLIPGIPNGGLDPLHPLSLQGALRPTISPPMNIRLPRQRCRDFEERGFCLRGDMCPMEHGVNRIVIEDVQSLSQFNLPVSIPGSQLLGTSSGHGALPMNTKAFHAKSSKPGMTEDGFGLNGGVLEGSVAGASDVYDPDQPLWANDNADTSTAILAINQSNADETEPFLDVDLSDRQNNEPVEGFNDDRLLRNATTAGSQSSSAWGRVGSSKHNLGVKEKIVTVGTSSSYLEKDGKSERMGGPDVPNQGKWTNIDGNVTPVKEPSFKKQNDSVRDTRKPAPRAHRTIFVYGVPLKDNKKEALLSHFQKFGEVIDIYIPVNGERAFVQFSKREEAEAALKAPDAVMGNRFIKLWWANRDSILDDRMSHNPFLENPRSAIVKDGNSHASSSQRPPVPDHPKPMVGNGPKAPPPPPPPPKKLENLELLKEQLRKKQEMLDQKRNEFRRQLEQLEKQAVGVKDVTASDLTPKRLKSEAPTIHAKAETSKENSGSAEPHTPSANLTVPPHTPSANLTVPAQELPKVPIRPQAPLASPFLVNKFQLDNRPTAFRIVSPLPSGLTDAAALEEHFSALGEVPSVVLEGPKLQENDASVSSAVSARVSFTTRRSAEKAFSLGKTYQGHKLQFVWLTAKDAGNSGNPPSASKVVSNTNAQPQPQPQPSGDNASSDCKETVEAEKDKDSIHSKSTAKEAGNSGNPPSASKVVSNTNVQPQSSGDDASSDCKETVEAEKDKDSIHSKSTAKEAGNSGNPPPASKVALSTNVQPQPQPQPSGEDASGGDCKETVEADKDKDSIHSKSTSASSSSESKRGSCS